MRHPEKRYKLQFGDIIEIKTAKGLAYAIYTHRHAQPPTFGALVRVFDKLYQTRPANLADIVSGDIRFSTFFPLQAAINKNIVEIVSNALIPDSLKTFPLFRSGTINPKTKKVDTWWLWDGEKSWQVGKLTTEQRHLPIRGVWNDTYLINRIEENWRPELDAT